MPNTWNRSLFHALADLRLITRLFSHRVATALQKRSVPLIRIAYFNVAQDFTQSEPVATASSKSIAKKGKKNSKFTFSKLDEGCTVTVLTQSVQFH